jgi:hypothetical protein
VPGTKGDAALFGDVGTLSGLSFSFGLWLILLRLLGQMLLVNNQAFDTPLHKRIRILGSTKPLKLDTLQCLAQRWDSPQALLWACPALVARFKQALFELKHIVSKADLSSSSKYFTYCEVDARAMQ